MTEVHGSPKRGEAEVAQMKKRLALYGLAVTGKCQWCGRPVWQDESLAEKAGPVCKRRNRTSKEAEAA